MTFYTLIHSFNRCLHSKVYFWTWSYGDESVLTVLQELAIAAGKTDEHTAESDLSSNMAVLVEQEPSSEWKGVITPRNVWEAFGRRRAFRLTHKRQAEIHQAFKWGSLDFHETVRNWRCDNSHKLPMLRARWGMGDNRTEKVVWRYIVEGLVNQPVSLSYSFCKITLLLLFF